MSATSSLETSSTTSFLEVSLSMKISSKEDGKERPALTLEERKSETPEEEAASSIFLGYCWK